MSVEEDIKMISMDTSQLITSLIVYKLASKHIPPNELSHIVDGGTDTIIEQLSYHVDKRMVEKVARDTSQNIKDMIAKMR